MGFDLGAEWAGIRTVATCEIDPYRQRLIREKYEGRDCIHHDDVRTFNYNIHADIISAGFPCQDNSKASGKNGVGIDGPKSGLWRHALAIVGKRRPQYVLIENVSNILIRGFGKLLHEFSRLGYVCEWECVQNTAFGFKDERERLFLIAYPVSLGSQIQWPVLGIGAKINTPWERARLVPSGSSIEELEEGLSQPAVFGENPRIPRTMDRIAGLGDAVNPYAAYHYFECIKAHRSRLQ